MYTIGPDGIPECPSILILDDGLLEGHQEFSIAIVSTNLNTEISSASVLVRILDDEGDVYIYAYCTVQYIL